jgi:hypothetical protein
MSSILRLQCLRKPGNGLRPASTFPQGRLFRLGRPTRDRLVEFQKTTPPIPSLAALPMSGVGALSD